MLLNWSSFIDELVSRSNKITSIYSNTSFFPFHDFHRLLDCISIKSEIVKLLCLFTEFDHKLKENVDVFRKITSFLSLMWTSSTENITVHSRILIEFVWKCLYSEKFHWEIRQKFHLKILAAVPCAVPADILREYLREFFLGFLWVYFSEFPKNSIGSYYKKYSRSSTRIHPGNPSILIQGWANSCRDFSVHFLFFYFVNVCLEILLEFLWGFLCQNFWKCFWQLFSK